MKQLLVFWFLLCSTSIFAQDVIVKKDGSTIVCRVVELSSSEITYKKWSDLNGSNYVMNRADASAINYEDGKKVNLSEVTNLYMPNNQNDGMQQYNDKALLKMDSDISNPLKILKTKRIFNWIGGIICGGIGSYFMGFGISDIIDDKGDKGRLWTLGVGAVGLTGGVLLVKNAINNTKQINKLQSYPIAFHQFKFKNGNDFYTRIDILRDQAINTQTIGFGLQYNF